MKMVLRPLMRVIARLAVYGSLGTVLTLLVVFVFLLNGRPDLDVWHTANLDEEFTEHSEVTTLAGYLELEDRLFQQLDLHQRGGIRHIPQVPDLVRRSQHARQLGRHKSWVCRRLLLVEQLDATVQQPTQVRPRARARRSTSTGRGSSRPYDVRTVGSHASRGHAPPAFNQRMIAVQISRHASWGA